MARFKRWYLPGMNQTYVTPRNDDGKVGIQHEGIETKVDALDDSLQFDGRRPGKRLSMIDEGMLMTIQEAFDDGVLDVLSERQRQCFTDVVISGDTYEKVAKRYRLRKSSVQSYITSASQRIRREIEKRNG